MFVDTTLLEADLVSCKESTDLLFVKPKYLFLFLLQFFFFFNRLHQTFQFTCESLMNFFTLMLTLLTESHLEAEV